MAKKTLYYKDSAFNISYEILNLDLQRTLVFLHGWGSNKALMKQAFKDCFKSYRHLYIDMPGFGNSSTPSFPLNSQDYKCIIESFLEILKVQPFSVFGHSFGGKIAILLNPSRLILLSSAGILIPKPFSVVCKIKFTKLSHKIIPGFNTFFKNFFRSSDVKGFPETMYGTFKKVVDEDFSNVFEDFRHSVWIFWGKEDMATPLYAGEKIHALIKDSKFFVLDGDHYFFLSQAKIIEEILLKDFEEDGLLD